jgi:hypothetical protein
VPEAKQAQMLTKFKDGSLKSKSAARKYGNELIG